MRPGAAQVISTLSDATSAESVFAHPASAGRNAFDTINPGIGCSTEDDTILTIRPHCAARIIGSTARVNRSALRKTCSKDSAHCFSVIVSKVPAGGPPQLFTRIETGPSFAFTFSMAASMSAADRQIARHGHLRADLFRDLVEFLLPPAQDGDARALFRQRLRARFPQSLTGRRHYRYFAADSEIHSHLMYLSRNATVRSKLSMEFSSREKLWPSSS